MGHILTQRVKVLQVLLGGGHVGATDIFFPNKEVLEYRLTLQSAVRVIMYCTFFVTNAYLACPPDILCDHMKQRGFEIDTFERMLLQVRPTTKVLTPQLFATVAWKANLDILLFHKAMMPNDKQEFWDAMEAEFSSLSQKQHKWNIFPCSHTRMHQLPCFRLTRTHLSLEYLKQARLIYACVICHNLKLNNVFVIRHILVPMWELELGDAGDWVWISFIA